MGRDVVHAPEAMGYKVENIWRRRSSGSAVDEVLCVVESRMEFIT